MKLVARQLMPESLGRTARTSMAHSADLTRMLEEAVAWVHSRGGTASRDALWQALLEGRTSGPVHQLRLSIASAPGYRELADAHLYVGETCCFLNHESVTEWLVLRATQSSAASSLQALDLLLDRKPIEATAVLALARVGIHGPGPIDLGHGVSLRRFSANDFLGLPPLAQVHRHETDVIHISAALATKVELPVHLLPAKSPESHTAWQSTQDAYFGALDQAYRALLVLGLVRPQPPALVGRALLVSPDLPGALSPSLVSHIDIDTAWPRLDLDPGEVDEAIALFDALERLPSGPRDEILVPMRRLRSAMTEVRDFADAAIDLGIALESLFVRPEEVTEITYRLSMRGAVLLGSSTDERTELKQRLAAIYSMRSTAAHRGVVPYKIKGAGGGDSEQLLQDGFRLAAAAIKKLLRWSPGDLDRLLLSSAPSV